MQLTTASALLQSAVGIAFVLYGYLYTQPEQPNAPWPNLVFYTVTGALALALLRPSEAQALFRALPGNGNINKWTSLLMLGSVFATTGLFMYFGGYWKVLVSSRTGLRMHQGVTPKSTPRCQLAANLNGPEFMAVYINDTFEDPGVSLGCNPIGCPCFRGLARPANQPRCTQKVKFSPAIDFTRERLHYGTYWFDCGVKHYGIGIRSSNSVTRVLQTRRRPYLQVRAGVEAMVVQFSSPVQARPARKLRFPFFELSNRTSNEIASSLMNIQIVAQSHSSSTSIIDPVVSATDISPLEQSSHAVLIRTTNHRFPPNTTIQISASANTCYDMQYPFGSCAVDVVLIPLDSAARVQTTVKDFSGNTFTLNMEIPPEQTPKLSFGALPQVRAKLIHSIPRALWGTNDFEEKGIISWIQRRNSVAFLNESVVTNQFLTFDVRVSGLKSHASSKNTIFSMQAIPKKRRDQHWGSISLSELTQGIKPGYCSRSAPSRQALAIDPVACEFDMAFTSGLQAKSVPIHRPEGRTARSKQRKSQPSSVHVLGSKFIQIYAKEPYIDLGFSCEEPTIAVDNQGSFDRPFDRNGPSSGVYVQTYRCASSTAVYNATRLIHVVQERPKLLLVGWGYGANSMTTLFLRFSRPANLDREHSFIGFDGKSIGLRTANYVENTTTWAVPVGTIPLTDLMSLGLRMMGRGDACQDQKAPYGRCSEVVSVPLAPAPRVWSVDKAYMNSDQMLEVVIHLPHARWFDPNWTPSIYLLPTKTYKLDEVKHSCSIPGDSRSSKRRAFVGDKLFLEFELDTSTLNQIDSGHLTAAVAIDAVVEGGVVVNPCVITKIAGMHHGCPNQTAIVHNNHSFSAIETTIPSRSRAIPPLSVTGLLLLAAVVFGYLKSSSRTCHEGPPSSQPLQSGASESPSVDT
ncbi:hypothetical protein DFS34DRAFT_625272 [Phlyctochytrium arcticum]|nr:hypothetical protein DFS34DRAFT_625272 [Phlyctochytrium arcticum]